MSKGLAESILIYCGEQSHRIGKAIADKYNLRPGSKVSAEIYQKLIAEHKQAALATARATARRKP